VTGFDPSGLLPLVEPLAVLTGIACVALTVRQRISNWPIGILSSALFLVLFLTAGLYADSLLQVAYIGLGLYGWRHWLTGGPRRDDLPVTAASPRLRFALILGAVAGTLAFGAFLDGATDSTVPYPDAATTVLSLVAQLLLTRKLVETWPVWIFGVNVPYIAIYLYKGLAMTAALQVVYIALSIAGWAAWRRSMAARAAEAGGEVEITVDADLLLAPVPVEIGR
jgi:nicotinamide mononucleotide transporter